MELRAEKRPCVGISWQFRRKLRQQQAEKPAAPAEPKVYAPAEPGSTEERIETFIKGLLEHMGSDAVPHDRPRYLMGVGTPANLLEAIDRGVDMFDCVMPTRNGRNACLFTAEGSPQHNARLKRGLSTAAYMQSEKEHNDAINYYLRRLPKNANAQQVNDALRKGIERERQLKRFWKDNRTLREYISPSSS